MAGKTYEIAFNLAAKLGNSFGSAFSGASQKLSILQTNCKTLRASMKELDAAQKKGAVSTAEWAGKYERLQVQLQRTEQLQRKLAKAAAWQNNAKGIKDKSKSAMETSAVAGAGLAAPAAVAVSFDTEMAYVAKQVDNARDQTGQLTEIGLQSKADILNISKDMMTMPDAVARAYAMSARFGVKGTENLRTMTSMAIMMGTAFELPAEQVATDMAKIGNALGYQLDTATGVAKLGALADMINYVDDQTVATAPDIIDYMQRTSNITKSLVPTMTEGFNVGLGAAFLSVGVHAENAGTAVKSMLTKFAAAPTQAKDFQGALSVVGMSAEELQQGMIDNADATILEVFKRINQLDEASRNNVLADLIGQEHIGTLSALAGGMDQVVSTIQLANSEAAKGSMRKEFEIMSLTAKRSLDGVQASLARASLAFGEALLPGLNEKSAGLSNLLEKIGAFARENPKLTSTLMVGAASLVGFAIAASTVTWVLSSAAAPLISFGRWMFLSRVATDGAVISSRAATLATGAWTAAQWLWNAAMTANPIGLVIVGIAALVAAGYWLWSNWDVVKAWFVSLWDDPTVTLQQFVDGIKAKFESTLNWLSDKWAWVKSIFSQPIQANVQANATAAGQAQIYENAAGGIYGQGSFMTTFAENSAEAAIPLDGSARSLSLYQRTGELMGVSSGGIAISAPFSPTIHMDGGANSTADMQQLLENERDKFRRMLEDTMADARRLSYG